jgi:predicted permease
MQIPILHGRDITEQDHASAPHVAVITEATARQFWGSSDAVGKRFRSDPGEPWMTVVGVSGNVVQTDLKLRPAAEYYVPHLQAGMYTGPNAIPAAFFSLALVVRTKGDPMAMLEPIRREIRGIDPGLALSDVATMDAVLSNSLWQPRLSMALIAAFAGLAVLLACLGVYGVVAYAVSQRTREFGVRTALGASPADLLRIVVRDGAALAATGIVIGTIGAIALSRGLSSLLFNTAPTDPVTFLGAAALLAAVVVGASLIPARRAMRVQPLTALRYE